MPSPPKSPNDEQQHEITLDNGEKKMVPTSELPQNKHAGDDIQEDIARFSSEPTETVNDKSLNAYQEGHNIVIEDSDGEVVKTIDTNSKEPHPMSAQEINALVDDDPSLQKVLDGEKAHAYQFENEIVVKNEDGEIVRTYILGDESGPRPKGRAHSILDKAIHAISAMGGHHHHSQSSKK